MANEAYTGAVMIMGLYGGLLQDVVRQYGWDKALEMHASQGWSMGVSTGQDIKKAASGREPDIAVVEACNASMMTGLGCVFATKKKERSVGFEISKCPLYDGLSASGFSHVQICSLCEAFDSKFYPGVKSVVPAVAGRVEFKKTPAASCLEQWEIH